MSSRNLKKTAFLVAISALTLLILAVPSMAMTNAEYRTPIYGKELKRYIVEYAKKVHIDPAATLAVAATEGGFKGAVGDGGSSFGPWQLHRGGALPSYVSNPRRWANAPCGIGYALRSQANVAKWKRGYTAISAIVIRFERPASPYSQISKAWGYYSSMRSFARSVSN